MDTFARNALRLTLAGAGILVLGAGYVEQASAAEAPSAPSAPMTPAVSGDTAGNLLPVNAGTTAPDLPTPGTLALPTVADLTVPGS